MSWSSAHPATARRARFIGAGIQISTFVLRIFDRGRPALFRRAAPKRTAEDPAFSIPTRQPKVRTAVRALAAVAVKAGRLAEGLAPVAAIARPLLTSQPLNS